MATRKQKHAEALARREAFLNEEQRRHAEVLRRDRETREQKLLDDTREHHNKKHSWKKRDANCPHCKIAINAAKHSARQLQEASSG